MKCDFLVCMFLMLLLRLHSLVLMLYASDLCNFSCNASNKFPDLKWNDQELWLLNMCTCVWVSLIVCVYAKYGKGSWDFTRNAEMLLELIP